ncbi:MAG TPA: hypothetical protein VFT27_11735 [Actinomycetota bacterium]|nr:hypothetical protein [Actinomycetota bacterium]
MTDTRPPTVQADRSSRRAGHRKKSSPALILIPLVLVVAAIVLFVALTRDGGGGIPFVGDDTPAEAPPFDFEVRKVRALPTSEKADEGKLASEAKAVEHELTPIVDDLFTNAFLDPANWTAGDYGEVIDAFGDQARPTAEGSIETLTLGTDAGEVFDEVAPDRSALDYKVLFDPDGKVSQVVVTVRFSALGTRADGGYTAIVSDAELFFDDPETWLISAFDVTRADQEAQPPSPSASASPSASGS